MAGRLISKRRRRFFGLGLLAAIVAGLFLTQLYLALRDPPTLQIVSIVPRMNFWRGRVQGILVSDARFFSDDTVLCLIDDGTGTLPVFMPSCDAENLPRAGQRVTVVGSLRVSVGNNSSLRATHIDVEPVPRLTQFYGREHLTDISADRMGERLAVYGQVSAIYPRRADSNAPYKIRLEDPSGRLDAVAWFTPERQIALGDVLKIHGEVDVYQGRPQLRVWEERHIQRVQ